MAKISFFASSQNDLEGNRKKITKLNDRKWVNDTRTGGILMVTYLKDILLIVFFIFSPLVFYPYIYKCKNNIILYRSLLAVLFSVILIIVMTVPINIQGVIYDFRSVIDWVRFMGDR